MEVTSGDDPISIPTWLRTFPSRTVGCKTIVKTSGFRFMLLYGTHYFSGLDCWCMWLFMRCTCTTLMSSVIVSALVQLCFVAHINQTLSA